ncbi:hypothetical protein Syun_020754 [Stephania yunnanensis]|uniref:Uncharacterized protein n=1 Tax=Stephania yunnanensis TaxID=152371 RepID=A0AAP0IGB6_9MAGN
MFELGHDSFKMRNGCDGFSMENVVAESNDQLACLRSRSSGWDQLPEAGKSSKDMIMDSREGRSGKNCGSACMDGLDFVADYSKRELRQQSERKTGSDASLWKDRTQMHRSSKQCHAEVVVFVALLVVLPGAAPSSAICPHRISGRPRRCRSPCRTLGLLELLSTRLRVVYDVRVLCVIGAVGVLRTVRDFTSSGAAAAPSPEPPSAATSLSSFYSLSLCLCMLCCSYGFVM